MKKYWISLLSSCAIAALLSACSQDMTDGDGNGTVSASNVDVAQTSGQLASGTSFRINGSSSDSTATTGSHKGKHRPGGPIDGLNLLAPTEELLTIVDAESASDFRGLRLSREGGATITHYDASGNTVTLPIPTGQGPEGCSHSGKQFPAFDSLLAKIVKTVIDFGSGVTFKRDTITITRSGKIVITRSGTQNNLTEVTTFDNYQVNGNKIEGTKTRTNIYDATTGQGTSHTVVTDGKITFSDGTVANWTSERNRTSNITLNSTTQKPESGTIVTTVHSRVVATDGTVIYSHDTTTPLTEDVSCKRGRRAPVSGALETHYRSNIILIDFGTGSCTSQTISITVNGVTTTKTIS